MTSFIVMKNLPNWGSIYRKAGGGQRLYEVNETLHFENTLSVLSHEHYVRELKAQTLYIKSKLSAKKILCQDLHQALFSEI